MANKSSASSGPFRLFRVITGVLGATVTVTATLAVHFHWNLNSLINISNINIGTQSSAPSNIKDLPTTSDKPTQQNILNCENISNKEACTVYNAGLQDLKAGNKFPGYEQMGRGSNDMGKPQDGLKYYTLAKNLPRSPYDDLTALSGQAWSLNLLHKPEEALKLANEVIVRDSNYPHIWPTKANAEMTLGRKKEACISAKKASELPEARRKQGRDLEQLIESACRIQ
jgi:tetratricopeptide (TPR) repeat protein